MVSWFSELVGYPLKTFGVYFHKECGHVIIFFHIPSSCFKKPLSLIKLNQYIKTTLM